MEIFVTLAISTIVFSALFMAAFRVWDRYATHIPEKDRKTAIPLLASYIAAGSHGLAAVVVTTSLLLSHPDWQDFSSPNTREQEHALAFSAGYFLADTIAYVIPHAADVVFLAHHVVTLAFLGAAIHLGIGATPCLVGLLLGEVTNPTFHVYNVVNDLRPWSPWAQNAFVYVSPVSTAIFVAVRTVLGIPIAWWWSSKIAAMEVPLLHKIIWIMTAVGITAVSQLFAHKFILEVVEILRSPKGGGKNTTAILKDAAGAAAADVQKAAVRQTDSALVTGLKTE